MEGIGLAEGKATRSKSELAGITFLAVVIGFMVLTAYRAGEYTRSDPVQPCENPRPLLPAAPESTTFYMFVNGANTPLHRADEGLCALNQLLWEGDLLLKGPPGSGAKVHNLHVPDPSLAAASEGRGTLAALLLIHPEVNAFTSFTIAAADILRLKIHPGSLRRDHQHAFSIIGRSRGTSSRMIVIAHSLGATSVQIAIDAVVAEKGSVEAAAVHLRCTGVLVLGAAERVRLPGLASRHLWTIGDIVLARNRNFKANPTAEELVALGPSHDGLTPIQRHDIVSTYLGIAPARLAVLQGLQSLNAELDGRDCPGARPLPDL
jgi:hypothetical protein